MLAVDFLEFLRGSLRILLLVQIVQALIVELVRGLIDEGLVLGHELVPERAGAASAQGNRQQEQRATQPELTALARKFAVLKHYTVCRHRPLKPAASRA